MIRDAVFSHVGGSIRISTRFVVRDTHSLAVWTRNVDKNNALTDSRWKRQIHVPFRQLSDASNACSNGAVLMELRMCSVQDRF